MVNDEQLSEPIIDFYDRLFEPLRLRSRSFRTKRLYRTTLNSFAKCLGRLPTLRDLNDDTVGIYLAWCARRELSPYSIAKERSNVLAIWHWANRRGVVKTWPDVPPEPLPEDDPVAWLQEELTTLFERLRHIPGTIGNVPAWLWWSALHAVIWDSGERISAVVKAEWQDVDLHGGWLSVPACNRKGKRKGATYRLHADTLSLLRPLSRFSACRVFPWPYTDNYLWNRYDKVLRDAGMPHDAKSKFHRMRRSVASHLEAAGGDATHALKHSHRKVTQRYLDPRIVPHDHTSQRLFRPWT